MSTSSLQYGRTCTVLVDYLYFALSVDYSYEYVQVKEYLYCTAVRRTVDHEERYCSAVHFYSNKCLSDLRVLVPVDHEERYCTVVDYLYCTQ